MSVSQGAPLAARELPALFERVHAGLASRREVLDDLNVFPVPDGDTGTNMTLTVRAGLDALAAVTPTLRPRRAAHDAARAVTRGVIRGARGNSGVITSQVIRAVVEVIAGHREVDAALYADALGRARDLAYEAVADPVEGTILTAIAAAAAAARLAADEGHDLASTSAAACSATADAVQRTRDQLEVLRLAGVVDAGARGFEILLAGVHGHITGTEPPVRGDRPPNDRGGAVAGCAATTDQPFEVQYLLDGQDADAAPLRRHLEALGDSVVVVAAGGLLNVHVHTAQVGPAIEAGLAYGRPSDIEVVHLGDQVAQRAGLSGAHEHASPPTRGADGIGVVAVLHGGGIAALARSAGAVVLDGRAGALPSVADLLDAIDATGTDRVVVLPGHRNGIAAATTAAEIARAEPARNVTIVDTAVDPPSVLAALALVTPDAPFEQVVADVHAAAAAVRTGSVVAAVRDARTPVGRVREGQPLAAGADGILAACATSIEALEVVCAAVLCDDTEVVTLLVGAGVPADERREAVTAVRAAVGSHVEVEVIDAGQRPARYWVGAE